MRVTAVLSAYFFVLTSVPACSSSSATSGAVDGARRDVLSTLDAGARDAPGETTLEAAASCTGLDAATQGLTFPKSCEACIAAHCCSQALACAAASDCKPIEQCAATCVAAGTAPQTCAEHCIAPDGSTSNLSPGQSAAETLDLCLASNCSSVCS